MKIFNLLLILSLSLIYIPANATELVGQSVVDGKKVNLYSDNTWQYESASKETGNPCVTLSKQIDFCDKLGEWKNLNSSSPDLLVLYSLGVKDWGMIVDESLGSNDGMNFETMRYAVIKRAANGSGVPFDEIEVISDDDIEFAGVAGVKIVYKIEYKGAPIIFSNTLLLTPTMNFQFITYTITKTLTASIHGIHEKFLSSITMN